MEIKNSKGIIILVVILAILVVGLGGFLVYDKILKDVSSQKDDNKGNNNPERTLEKGNFQFKENLSEGTVQVEGYVTTKQRCLDDILGEECDEDDPCVEECQNFDDRPFVVFNVLRSGNSDFQAYLKYLGENRGLENNKTFDLGCIENEVLSCVNFSDKYDVKEYKFSKSDTSTIMASTKEKPIILELEQLVFSLGKGTDGYCFSPITNIKIIP